jgi:hypothetical protein
VIVDYATRYPEVIPLWAAVSKGITSKMLKQMLRKVIQQDVKNWDQLLPHHVLNLRSPLLGFPLSNSSMGGDHAAYWT